ncbi:MAG: GHKL domain-containing protein [Oscillospiraceae bacterium]|nr:GHKL domain-containing protein [Oscillospiraceae bacterium]
MMEKQVGLQISHYNELEKMDAEISRFRHDYTNHLQSILSLIQMNEYSQAEEYIQKLKKVQYKSDLQMFYTGHKLADAILSDRSSALGKSCRIEYSGIIPSPIDNVDLCIILSNSLDNAAEACRELPSPGVISIYAAEQQGYFVLSVKNPTVCTEKYYDIPATTKPDKEHHGMGLHNIESTVKRRGGQMRIKCENGSFELMITMKMSSFAY